MRAPRSLSGGGFGGNAFVDAEDVDPRVGLVNLADVMLVFACGLMLALVIHWNVNVGVTELDETEMTQIEEENIANMAENFTKEGSSYNELGVVYQDPTTGQMYLLQEEDDE